MQFAILGPLEATDGGRPLVLTRAKQRALLTALLLRPNEAVSTDRLLEALWGERPPPTALTALQGHVSHLRKVLPPDRLRTGARGYLLHVEPGELDLERFEELRRRDRSGSSRGWGRHPALRRPLPSRDGFHWGAGVEPVSE